MAGLFSSPSIPKPSAPAAPKTEDMTTDNAANAERIRRLAALGKKNSTFAGMLTPYSGGGMPKLTTLGG